MNLPNGFHEQADGTLVCPHRNQSTCADCAERPEIVTVSGAHYWIPDPADQATIRRALDIDETARTRQAAEKVTPNPRPYILTIDNVEANRACARGETPGSSFPPVNARRFKTIGSARARARNLLSEQYDPALPLRAQPIAFVETPDGLEAYVMVPYVGFRRVEQITDADRAESDLRRDVREAVRT